MRAAVEDAVVRTKTATSGDRSPIWRFAQTMAGGPVNRPQRFPGLGGRGRRRILTDALRVDVCSWTERGRDLFTVYEVGKLWDLCQERLPCQTVSGLAFSVWADNARLAHAEIKEPQTNASVLLDVDSRCRNGRLVEIRIQPLLH